MRVLITGSRDWADAQAVQDALYDLAADQLTIVHGACPTGADYHAQVWAIGKPWVTVERHPANWKRWGPKAGPERNVHMVGLGADLCLAFIGPCTSPRCRRTDEHPSHGASGCADLAQAAGIPVRRFTPERWPAHA